MAIPSILQVGAMYGLEIVNYYVIGKTGDYGYIDALAMSNFLIYTGVYGTAIIFNMTIETLVPHALATNKHDITGHLLNRAMFLWFFFFAVLFAGMFNIDTILVLGLEWDDDDASRI